jgi:hypothetical protein
LAHRCFIRCFRHFEIKVGGVGGVGVTGIICLLST